MKVNGELYAVVALPPRKDPPHRAGNWEGTKSRSGRCGELKLFPRVEPRLLGRPSRDLVTILTELSRLPDLDDL
jgi:hypothetical protein